VGDVRARAPSKGPARNDPPLAAIAQTAGACRHFARTPFFAKLALDDQTTPALAQLRVNGD
jgi:hypothetical protein